MEVNIAVLLPGLLWPNAARGLPKGIHVLEAAALDEAAAVARDLEKQGVEVIISRGGTAKAIRKAVETPVVAAEATSFDILEILWYVKKKYPFIKRVALVNYQGIFYDTDKMSEMVGFSIEQYWYKHRDNLAELVRDLVLNKGHDFFIGGVFTVKHARDLGVTGVLQRIGLETMMQAVQKASEIIGIRRQDREREERLRAILDFIHEGVLSVDANNVVTICNPAAERILDLHSEKAIGQNLSELFAGMDWSDVLREGNNEIGQIMTIQDNQIVINRIPIKLDHKIMGVVSTFQKVDNLQNTEQKIRKELFAKGLVARFSFKDIIGRSQSIKKAIKQAGLFAQADSTILISGESGTGKEIFAQSIHQSSRRKEGPFVAVNCAALPENLLESELFGYEEGAFTGAKKGGKPGMFELAHNGTIFLDEIGEVPLNVQVRLLRVIQEKEVMRVGGERVIPVNARIIAATNRDLGMAVERGEFREDLFYRINILYLNIPSLRQRVEDIPLLMMNFIDKYSRRYNKKIDKISDLVMKRLTSYHWPGNVRELENFSERFVILRGEDMSEIELVDELLLQRSKGQLVSAQPQPPADNNFIQVRIGALGDMEDEIIQRVNELLGGNKSEVAQLLGISRTTVWKKTKNLDL